MAEISPELDALCCELIGFAIERLEQTDVLPVLLAVDCEEEVLEFGEDTPDGCYRAACMQVASYGPTCSRYALVYDGFVQEDEFDSGDPALLIEFAERGMDSAWSGYMLYRRDTDGAIEVTDPMPGGVEDLLFA